MDIGSMYAVDLKDKIAERGWTQEEFASRFPFNPEHIGKVIRGARPISFWFAAVCAREFGFITVRQPDGSVFVLSNGGDGRSGDHNKAQDEIPNDEQLNDLDAAEHISNVRNQAADVVDAANRVERRWLAIRNGCPQGAEDFAHCYAEAFELKWAVDGLIEDGETERPELVKRGLHIALQRRPGYLKEGEGVEPAA